MNGVLVVDKPRGPTSHDVVARVRRATGIARIGHTGTLDPLATGVLPLVLGRATRLARFLSGAEKTYVAGIRFGAETATYDAEGMSDGARPVPPSGLEPAQVRDALRAFGGSYLQTPPPFSAKKVGGVAAYTLARREKPAELQPVPVTVHAITLERYQDGVATVRLVCSAGFYVRVLARDLGRALGCGAYLESLRRTRAGDFDEAQAVTLEAVERDGGAEGFVPIDALLPALPPVTVTERGARRAAHGNALAPDDLVRPAVAAATHVRVLDPGGTLIGIAEETAAGLLHPVVVLV